MAQLRQIGPLSLAEFHKRSIRIVREVAGCVLGELAQGDMQIHSKTSYSGVAGADVVTSVDTNAQQRLSALATRLLPSQLGQIGEENNLRRPSQFTNPTITVTFDPVDGTRSLIDAVEAGRLPLSGESSVMMGLQVDGEAVAGYICDVATLEVYCISPFDTTVTWIRPDGAMIDTNRLPRAESLSKSTLLIHGRRTPTSGIAHDFIGGDTFKYVRHGTHSLGLTVAGVLAGKTAAILRPSGAYSTPWDDTPLQAMCSRGSILMLKIGERILSEVRFDRLDQTVHRDYDILYLHRRYLEELRQRVHVMLL